MRFGYRLMRGRQGVSGHARATGEKATLSARGLAPGKPCVLYALREQEVHLLETRAADREGSAQFAVDADDRLFLAQDGRVVLWEDGPDAEAQYLRACAFLRGETAAQTRKSDASDALPPHPAARSPETAPKTPEPDEAPSQAQRRGEKRPALRPAGSGEAVDALPILRWPAGTEDLRLNCTLRPPFAPFYAPGWRFVQVPSPLPEAPFCAVGYRVRDARVTEVAYAIPGQAQRPPVRLAGYHYAPGRHSQGYWVMRKSV